MKKLLAIAVALVMVMALSVSVFADYSYTFTDGAADGWWENPGLANDADLVAALKEAGAKLVITIDNAEAAENGFQYGFQDTSSWANILIHSNFAGGEGNLGAESVEVVDGKTIVTVDGAALVAAAEAAGSNLTSWQWVNGSSTGDTLSIAVTTGAAAPADDAAAADDTAAPAADDTAAPADDTNDAPAAPAAPAATENKAPATGLALAVVPAIMALAAVTVSKKR